MRLLALFICMLIAETNIAADLSGSLSFKQSGANRWQLHYCFNSPIKEFQFSRSMTGNMHADYWDFPSDEFDFKQEEDGTHTLSRADNKPFRCFDLHVKTYTKLPEKNYLAFSEFTDGGVSVFTGYYQGVARTEEADNWQETKLSVAYIPLEGNSVYKLPDTELGEQFVYFGPSKADEIPSGKLVVDTAIPKEVRDDLVLGIKSVNEYLQSLFSAEETPEYLIFIAGGELLTTDGISIKGGARPDQLLFTFKGTGTLGIIEKEPRWLPTFIAHEVSHLWQHKIWEKLGEDQPWVHEGGAENLARAVLKQSGIFTPDEYSEEMGRLERRCVRNLNKSSVYAGGETGNSKVFYNCGNVVYDTVAQTLNPKDRADGALTFWQALAAHPAEKRNASESEKLVFETFKELGLSDTALEAIRAFLQEKHDDPEAAIETMKQAVLRG